MSIKKFEAIKSMNTLICSLNNEDAYMCWINLVPDCADDEDLMWFAESENDEEFKEAVKLFNRLWTAYYKDGGLYVGNKVY